MSELNYRLLADDEVLKESDQAWVEWTDRDFLGFAKNGLPDGWYFIAKYQVGKTPAEIGRYCRRLERQP